MSILMRYVGPLVRPVAVNTAWSPGDIADLSHWIDASDASTITATGSDLTTIADKSSNGFDMTAGNDPQIGTRTLNGLDLLDFDGVDQYIQDTSYTPPGDWQHVVLYQADDSVGGRAIFRVGGTSRVLYSSVHGTFHGPNIALHGSGNVGTFYGSAANIGVPLILRLVYDLTTGEWKQYQNGTLRVDDGSNLGTVFNSERMVYGASHYAAGYINGFLGEGVIVENLIDSDGQKIEGYIAHKWGLEANLPESHPYKSAPPI